jgi:hypothetical protein
VSQQPSVRNYQFVECRSLGHQWVPDNTAKSRFGYTIGLRCLECDTIRVDAIDVFGDVFSRTYRQPKGYKNTSVKGRKAYRLEMLRRRTRG